MAVCVAAVAPATDIVARPKELYAKLGFDPVSTFWQFTKPPEGESYR